MKSGIEKEYTKRFFLDEAKLRRIAQVIQSSRSTLGKPSVIAFHVKRSDNSYYETTEIDDILKDDNSRNRRIVQLAVLLLEESSQSVKLLTDPAVGYFASVVFSTKDDESVRLRISDENRDWCFLLYDELEAQITRCLIKGVSTKIHRKIDYICAMSIMIGCLLYMVFVSQAKSALSSVSLNQVELMSADEIMRLLLRSGIRDTQIATSLSMNGPIGGMVLGPLIILFSPISRMFKKIRSSVFHWGDMIADHENQKRSVSNLVWIIGIGLLVSIVAGIIVARLIG